MKLNNLSHPPGDEPWQHKLSRLASDIIIPFLIPASTAFLLWLAKRKENANHQKEEDLQRQIVELKSREDELDARDTQASFYKFLQEEDAEYRKINQDLDKIATGLKDRQDIYCSVFKKKEDRIKIESQLLEFAYSRPYDKNLKLYRGLNEIFAKDTHCGSSRDENGCLMWVWLDFWRMNSKLLKYEKASEKILNKLL
ncbi:coiled-coil domain-containing protein 127-like [Anneissia japonica]|uniref:coiled-coil domain-containing protein 127-like n=1 Tax=Anneissia japonica TaxID=1529436 RepID=UPI0014255C97|nr:coiled-coil domain-containing protein 127-like [Anneissia japonica]